MLNNYLKSTFRHTLKNRINSLFKFLGLALAFFSLLVIVLYVSWQLSFDSFHRDADRIFRVNGIRNEAGSLVSYAVVPPALGPAMKASLPEVEAFARIGIPQRSLIKYNDKTLRPNGFVDADSSIFDVLTFKFIHGNKHALDNPASIILAQSLASQIFGDEDPIGKSISFVDRFGRMLTVTAVIEDVPANAHLDIRAIMSRGALDDDQEKSENSSWHIDAISSVYVKLNEAGAASGFQEKVQPIIDKNLIKRQDGSEQGLQAQLQPVREIFLAQPLKMEFCRKGSILYVYVFSVLGLFILVVAGTNYVNLSVAAFAGRAREMGVRKILGAHKVQIIAHVIAETFLFCGMALIASLGTLYLVFPSLLRQLDPNLNLNQLLQPQNMLVIIFILGLILLSSIIVPSLILSARNPVDNLQSSGVSGKNRVGKSLLVVQFVASVMCMLAILVVSDQMAFIRNTDIGYNRHQVVSLLMPDRYPVEKAPALKTALAGLAGVESVSFSYYMISGAPYLKSWYNVESEGTLKPVMTNEVFVDHDFIPTMGIRLSEGRNFDLSNSSDSRKAFIVNESAVREFGWKDPIGKRIAVGHDPDPSGEWSGVVVGVVKDFNIRPLRERIEPLIMRLQFDNWPGYWLNVRFNGPQEETIASIKSTFETVLPGFQADHRLVTDVYDRQYQNENRAMNALEFSTWVVMFISALGIFSLAAYLSMKRMKEFGIRKVLGASLLQIVANHLGYFFRVMLLANIIALPLTYWLMQGWLDGFAYRVELGVDTVVLVIAASFVLLLVASGYSSFRSARMNPVDIIRN